MDIRKVKKLIELLEESAISEIEIHEGEESVRISRHAQPGMIAPQPMMVAAPNPLDSMALQQHHGFDQKSSKLQGRADASATDEDDLDLESGFSVTAPMVGTFYTSPAPGEPSFVNAGDNVKAGDVLCIIEAMKMLNQIEAEKTGVIKKVLVENGQPVEFGQPLFIIDEV